MTKQGRPLRAGLGREPPTALLSLITDLIFVSVAVYLLLGYAWTLSYRSANLLVVLREAFLVAYLLMALAFLAIRKSARAVTRRKRDYVYTIIGFSAPLLLQPARNGGPVYIAATLEFTGLAFVISAFLYLNRSFGLAPQNRGIKTAGVYRLVRHPMYLGYILAEVGYVFDNVSNLNLLVLIVSVLFLVLRLRAEEHLLERDRLYRNYSRKTRWRLIPLLF